MLSEKGKKTTKWNRCHQSDCKASHDIFTCVHVWTMQDIWSLRYLGCQFDLI